MKGKYCIFYEGSREREAGERETRAGDESSSSGGKSVREAARGERGKDRSREEGDQSSEMCLCDLQKGRFFFPRVLYYATTGFQRRSRSVPARSRSRSFNENVNPRASVCSSIGFRNPVRRTHRQTGLLTIFLSLFLFLPFLFFFSFLFSSTFACLARPELRVIKPRLVRENNRQRFEKAKRNRASVWHPFGMYVYSVPQEFQRRIKD